MNEDGKCVTEEECKMCKLDDMLIKDGDRFEVPDECTEYICTQGELTEQSVCQEDYACKAGEVLEQVKGKCCPECRPAKNSTDKCRPHTSMEFISSGDKKCKSTKPVSVTYCQGTCGNSMNAPMLLVVGSGSAEEDKSECKCCTGTPGDKIEIDVICDDARVLKAHYKNMLSCACEVCEGEKTSQNLGLPKK